MRILAIETATADCSVALALGEVVLERHARSGAEKPSEQVPGLIRQLLAESGISLTSLDAIAFDIGPGAFTGIRIGCGLAQGMAVGADLPLIGLSSLRVLAMQAPEGRVLAALDARMGEIYWAPYHRVAGPVRDGAVALADARVEPPTQFVCSPDIGFAVGDGLSVVLPSETLDVPLGPACATGVRVLDGLPSAVTVIDPRARPRAADMIPLALCDLEDGLAVPPEAASPLYVRDKVALTAAEQIARRAAR